MESPELHFISRLSDYSLRSVLTRIALVSGTAVLFLFMAVQVAGDAGIEVSAFDYFRTVLAFNIITEANVLFDHLAERSLPIPEKISLRLILHIVISLLLGGVLLGTFIFTDQLDILFLHPLMHLMILLGFIFIIILILVSVTVRIIEKWVFSIRQLDLLKNLKLASDYHSLQAQLNPHFLFNNLSTLRSMITYEPEAAVQFTQNFTDVYRYVLECKDKVTIKLSDELEFMEAYMALHLERMGESLRVETRVQEAAQKKDIPPLALQQLVENALKHNVALKDDPLVIRIDAQGDTLRVINNLNPKDSDFSEKTGLINLVQRYTMLTEKPVNIRSGKKFFEVEIPLL
jgi:two-component system, LytTR family, sensor kinase